MGSPHRILVVDDDAKVLQAHARLVEALGYEYETAADGIEALAKLPLDVDLVLLDGEMPNMDGFEVARRIRESPHHMHLPIVMVTGLTRTDHRLRAMEVGINDFIQKPMDVHELELRAKWLIEMKRAFDHLKSHDAELARRVEMQTHQLRNALEEMTEAQRRTQHAHIDTIRRLMVAAEYRDHDTAGHIERIGLYSEVVARAIGLSPSRVELMRHAAPMHDVGKLGVPDAILLKPGPLSDEEWTVMRAHTTMGAEILTGSSSPVIQLGERIALSHHERWNGSGYPLGLAGEDIPLEGRICAVVDVFDALTMERPYRAALPVDTVIEHVKQEAGKHFDEHVLVAFLDSSEEILSIKAETT